VAAVAGVLDHAKGQRPLALAVSVAGARGLRRDELRRQSLAGVGLGAVVVRAESGPAATAWLSKGKRERRIPVPAEIAALARAFVRARTAAGWRLADGWTTTLLAAACDQAGVAAFSMHDLRRTFATEAVRQGIPLPTVQTWLCHRSIRTTQRYLGRYARDASLEAPAPAALAVYRSLYRTGVVGGALEGTSGTYGPGGARDRPFIVQCHTGRRSLKVTHLLREAGFPDVKSMAGGIELWAIDIDPNVPRY
jgi:rhodanese-related sulfurtransferase